MRRLPPTPCATRPGKETARNRNKKATKESTIGRLLDIKATIARTPRNCKVGPDNGCAGGSPSQAGTYHASLRRISANAPQRQPASTSRPTSGSRKPPASKRLQETSVAGQRRRTYGSKAMYRTQKKEEEARTDAQKQAEEAQFGETRDVMRAKEPTHRRSHKNKSRQTKGPSAIAPAQAHVPPGKHRADHQHRKHQNNARHY